MISAEVIDSDYRIVYGGANYSPDKPYHAVSTHNHYIVDTTSPISRIVHASVEAGLDVITVTDHDSTAAQDKVRKVVSDNGYKIDVIPGIEVTARGPNNAQRHVLVYGVEDAPPTGLSPAEVNAWAHEHTGEVYTAAAHPELLIYSVQRAELAAMQQRPQKERFDFGEVINGDVLALQEWEKQHPHLARIIKNKLPPNSTNDTMQRIVLAQTDTPVLGGNDSHNRLGVANVVNLVPVDMSVFEAAQEGTLVVAAKKEPQAPRSWRLGVGYTRGTIIKDTQLRHQWARAARVAA